MLRGERWLMSKEDAGEKVLTVDDGAKLIGIPSAELCSHVGRTRH